MSTQRFMGSPRPKPIPFLDGLARKLWPSAKAPEIQFLQITMNGVCIEAINRDPDTAVQGFVARLTEDEFADLTKSL